MSDYPTGASVPPTPPIGAEPAIAVAVPAPQRSTGSGTGTGARASQAADTVKDAAGQAKATAADTAGQAKEQAQQVGATAAEAGGRVGATAKDQATKVASDAVGQARELYGQATEQLSEQAGKQQKNAAATLRTFGDDLSTMHDQDSSGGLAAELVHTLSERAESVAGWLESREPGEVLDEVKQFAARRPGLFIGIAAVAGLASARAVKALSAGAKSGSPTPSPARSADDAGRSGGTPGTYYPGDVRTAADPYGAGGDAR